MGLYEVVWKDMSIFLSMTMLPLISSQVSLMFRSVRCMLFTCSPYHVAFTTAQCENDYITAVFQNGTMSISGQKWKILTVTSGGSNMYRSTYDSLRKFLSHVECPVLHVMTEAGHLCRWIARNWIACGSSSFTQFHQSFCSTGADVRCECVNQCAEISFHVQILHYLLTTLFYSGISFPTLFALLTSTQKERDSRCFVSVNRLPRQSGCERCVSLCMFLLLLWCVCALACVLMYFMLCVLCVHVQLIKELLRDGSHPMTSKPQESFTYLDL